LRGASLFLGARWYDVVLAQWGAGATLRDRWHQRGETMPIRYQVIDDLVLSKFSGQVTNEELLEHVTAVGEDARVRPGFTAVADMRGVTTGLVTFNGLLAMVDEIDRRPERLSGSRLGVVAPGDVPFGMARAYAAVGEHQRREIQVFRTVEEAEAWAGAPLGDCAEPEDLGVAS